MGGTLRLYALYLAASVRAQAQYRASLALASLGHLLGTVVDFLGIWVLFQRFSNIQGWGLAEIALFYGIIGVAFTIADGIAGGFDSFGDMVKSGDFDRLLVRPRSTALQVAGRELQVRRIGGLSQSLVVLLWASAALEVAWTPARLGLLLLTIAGGMCLFSGLFILQATLAFWTTESLEIMNTMTYGGRESAEFPLTIYRDWFRRFFTFVVPLACVSYYPTLAVLGRRDSLGSPEWFGWVAPLVGVVFLVVCLRLWEFGVRHYRSTGS